MHLTKLELSGFKSFARTTTLEFPARITGIVGPNGSGKSNITEGLRWVLGEQSIKTLRGKRGEDLIWNGSPAISRMGKASVALTFNNEDGRIPVDFSEIVIGRKIFRDGLNEYLINNSHVRLKDVAELMARIGLGPTQHNIISQGEVDRILLSSARERRELLEEALGLRLYQLKKHEAERKLESTETNRERAEGLMKEILPHLKFLRQQAHKAETRGELEREFLMLQAIYLHREWTEIAAEHTAHERARAPLQKREREIRDTIQQLLARIEAAEQTSAPAEHAAMAEKESVSLEERRRELEREIGRLEGTLEAEKTKLAVPRVRVVDARFIRDEIQHFLDEIRELLEAEDQIEIVKPQLTILLEDMERLMGQIEKGTIEEPRNAREREAFDDLERRIRATQEHIKDISETIRRRDEEQAQERRQFYEAQQQVRKLDAELRAAQDEERTLTLQLERLGFNEERLRMRKTAFEQEQREANLSLDAIQTADTNGYEGIKNEELKRKVDRLRIKLEEIGGIDAAIIKEYEETDTRHNFLAKETEDLREAARGLKSLIKELDEHIKNDFKTGFSKIKKEFGHYFAIIFGGGDATLTLTEETVKTADESTEEEQEGTATPATEHGVELAVNLPRKRIKGLAMLSGGERALTSIALLFAITAVNPPPFLILDETDAALDEANSQRYAAILQELAKKTQLILVTHNRETMKCAGVLYGVTMGADGVSKLISLKFEEAEAYTNR